MSNLASPDVASRKRSRSSPTPRVHTASSRPVRFGDRVVAAVCENRLREVGIALLRVGASVLELHQFADAASYVHTTSLLRREAPNAVLVPTSAGGSELERVLLALLTGAPSAGGGLVGPPASGGLIRAPRRHFSEASHPLAELALDEDRAVAERLCAGKYLAAACASAALTHLEEADGITFERRALRVQFVPLDGTMCIDWMTADRLELVRGARSGAAAGSVLAHIDRTRTHAGRRLLRINLLQPPSQCATIQLRQASAAELLARPDAMASLDKLLGALPDPDSLASVVARHIPPSLDFDVQAALDAVVRLRRLLEAGPLLATAIDGVANTPLLSAVRDAMRDPSLETCRAALDRFLNDSVAGVITASVGLTTGSASGSVLGSGGFGGGGGSHSASLSGGRHLQSLDALRSGLDAGVDAARAVFLGVLREVRALHMRDSAAVPELSLRYAARRGYYYSLPVPAARVHAEWFARAVQVVEARGRLTLTTPTLASLSSRLSAVELDLLNAARGATATLLVALRPSLAALHRMREAVALLDLVYSIARYASEVSAHVFPEITEDGAVAIRDGRHVLLDRDSDLATPLVPNSLYVDATSRVQIIGGANMAGKTTYLKQSAVLIVLAHIGYTIPATFASVRLTDALLSRVGVHDALEDGASSFMQEMRDVSTILHVATERSFVIVDELGRATTPSDGVALSWAFCECALATGAFVLLSTHFSELAALEELYPAVANFHMAARPAHALRAGRTEARDYGLELATEAGLPTELVAAATDYLAQLGPAASVRADPAVVSRRGVAQLAARLDDLSHTSLTGDALQRYKRSLAQQFSHLRTVVGEREP